MARIHCKLDGKMRTPKQVMELVKKFILAEPGAYDQEEVCGLSLAPSCESPACIAGWMSHIVFGKQRLDYLAIHEAVFGTYVLPWLFYGDFGGRPKYGNALIKAKSPMACSRIACKAIDAYMKELAV